MSGPTTEERAAFNASVDDYRLRRAERIAEKMRERYPDVPRVCRWCLGRGCRKCLRCNAHLARVAELRALARSGDVAAIAEEAARLRGLSK